MNLLRPKPREMALFGCIIVGLCIMAAGVLGGMAVESFLSWLWVQR